jgi:hypothetical protein
MGAHPVRSDGTSFALLRRAIAIGSSFRRVLRMPAEYATSGLCDHKTRPVFDHSDLQLSELSRFEWNRALLTRCHEEQGLLLSPLPCLRGRLDFIG